MPFENEIDLLRAGARGQTSDFLGRIRTSALHALREDMSNAALAEPADAYIYRANAIALGVADVGAAELADQIYQDLVHAVEEEISQTGEHRHRGALLANRAILNINQQRYDVGVPLLQHVIQVEDPKTYGVAPEDSFGNQLRKQWLDDPALRLLLQVLKDAKLPLGKVPSVRELDGIFRFLGESAHVLYAVILGLHHNIRFALREVRTNYTALRMFDAFRTYAFFLEELTGRMVVVQAQMRRLEQPSHPSGIELRDGLTRLFGMAAEQQAWWPRLNKELRANSASCRRQPIDMQNQRLEELSERQPESVEDTAVDSLAILHLVRNIGAHEIYAPAYLVAPEVHLERILGWMTAAAVVIFRENVGTRQVHHGDLA